MAKYIIQLRRGTAEEWATVGKDIVPLEGELVLELDKSGNNLHRLKIGDGVSLYSELPYMSVDSFILPRSVSVTLYADKWEQTTNADGEVIADTYYQIVTVDNATITSNSKVDLNPNSEQLSDFFDQGLVFTAVNDGGTVSVHVVGGKPEKEYQIQATVTEVIIEEEVITDE